MNAQTSPFFPSWLPTERLAEFCRRWGVKELYLFGSALREDFGPKSDVDFLYVMEPDCRPGFDALFEMMEELETLMGRKVDFVSKEGVERSRNPFRRKAILSAFRPIYVAQS